jgi:MoxR-like ATPase
MVREKGGEKMVREWELAQRAIELGATRLLIWGPPGVGKSKWALAVLARGRQHPPVRVYLNQDITAQELLGHWIPRGQTFEWHHGPIARAWLFGTGLVIDEVGRASGPVLDLLLAALDDPEVARITLPSGEEIRPNSGFACIATSNSDPESLDSALLDRFEVILHVTTPHPSLIEFLNSQREGLGDFVRDSFEDPERAVSPRRALTFARLTRRGGDDALAAQLAFGERANDVLAALRLTP